MKLNKLLVALSLTFISGSVLAAGGDTATLKVTGKLVPGACAVNLDNAGIVDYGTMLMTNLSATEDNQLPEKRINMGIKCNSERLVAYTLHDERRLYNGVIKNATVDGSDIPASSNQFGLGLTNDGETTLGAYTVINWFPDMTYSGSTDNLVFISKKITSDDWLRTASGSTVNGVDVAARLHTLGNPDTLTPAAFSELKVPLSIKGVLRKGEDLKITDETNLDGEATISLVYL
ncbi:hypothetical protein B9P90_00950 [Citrobacter freundii]|uniref:DUF1120 domain-containing protein n=1 Tax=Citrobacter freundii TaxID=546 RepID=A0AA44NPY4_CITFR|nr:DUF1120 domain-containing protein [Citrobacter freundii]OYR01149.1 hypothetical protein B9P90_00950 [Citrobacter freundii]OYR06948.1 hypothetical protein B9P89_02855 [Citrobacter freundii]